MPRADGGEGNKTKKGERNGGCLQVHVYIQDVRLKERLESDTEREGEGETSTSDCASAAVAPCCVSRCCTEICHINQNTTDPSCNIHQTTESVAPAEWAHIKQPPHPQ